MLDPSALETRYAKSGSLNIAYQVFGEGDARLVLIPGWASNVENLWMLQEFAEFARRLSRFAKVILIDRRGTGLSDPVSDPPTFEEQIDDLRAVLDAVGWQRAAIWGVSEGGPMAMVFAASHPERVSSLVLYGTFARFSRDHDYAHGYPPHLNERWLRMVETGWGTGELSRHFAPTGARDATVARALARLERTSMSPGTALKLFTRLTQTDVRHVLGTIRVPTLVLHRTDDQPLRAEHGRYLGRHISGARYVEIPGEDHMPMFGDTDTLLAEVREFLTGDRIAAEVDRVLTTVLFCDISGSTERAAELGDQGWADLLSRFYAVCDEKLQLHRGRKVDTAGDGLYAAFDGPGRAVRFGASVAQAMEDLGVSVRVGVHTGECEVLAGKYSGIAVHICARVAELAERGQVFVTSTVKDLVVGSELRFEDRGTHTLKGVPEPWRLHRLLR